MHHSRPSKELLVAKIGILHANVQEFGQKGAGKGTKPDLEVTWVGRLFYFYSQRAQPLTAIERFLLPATILMDYTSLSDFLSKVPSLAPILLNFERDALKRRTSLIQTTVNECLKNQSSSTRARVGKEALIELTKSGHLWLFVEGDQDHYLTNDPTVDSSEQEWKLSPQDVGTVKQMLKPDAALLQRAAQTTPAMRIGMIIWLVITSLTLQNHCSWRSAYDKWDVQGRAITIWANTFSEIIHSKKRPSEVIPTDDNALAAFKSAMDIAGHHHNYQATPDLGTWATMRAALFPELKGKPISWFDMVRVLGAQYQSQDEGKKPNWRPRVSLAAAHALDEEVLGEKFPPLNFELLPEYVQRAVKRFCRATEGDEHTCTDYDGYSWGELDVEVRTRYAAAYAQLYSTHIVPLLGDESDYSNNCDTCNDIDVLYDCVDAISAGQITLGSQNIGKVLGFIKQLALISDDCKFTFPEDRLDVDDSNNSSESSQRPDDQQRAGNSEVIHDETHNAAISTQNAMNHFDPTPLTQPEASGFSWQESHSAIQIYNFAHQTPLNEYTTMTEGHASAQDHVGGFNNLRLCLPGGDSESLLFRDVILDSSLGEVTGSHVVSGANWSTEQPQDLMATYNVAGASRPKDIDNVGPKISKEAKKKELHAFFVTLFKKHDVPLGTTGMAEARLPWKKMMGILADQDLEIAGWPEGVPKPRSDGKADKGISGFNTEHIAALYKAMKAGQIDFRPLAGGSPTSNASRVRQRKDDMEEEVNMRPTKKRKLAETRKKPKDFVAMQSVMKF
ncbi:hypothetical protein C8R44DRAFT_952078 [Mycena epipterygia]|nr:hypothetical protein C8R44DRAFT_952078 [Mycena epipterygia]